MTMDQSEAVMVDTMATGGVVHLLPHPHWGLLVMVGLQMEGVEVEVGTHPLVGVVLHEPLEMTTGGVLPLLKMTSPALARPGVTSGNFQPVQDQVCILS